MSQVTHEAPSQTVSTRTVVIPAGPATMLFGVDPGRRAATIVNQGTEPVWLAGTDTISAANGFYLPAGAGYVWTSTAPAFAFVGGVTDGLLCVLAESGEG